MFFLRLVRNDVVFLSEIKTSVNLSVTGYMTILSNTKNGLRGGCAVLVKNSLCIEILSLDITHNDQIWINFRFDPHTLYGGCYIPPHDSPNYDIECHANLQEIIKLNPDKDILLLGDMNARFGASIMNLVNDLQMANLQYVPSNDPVGGLMKMLVRHYICVVRTIYKY